MPPRLVAPFGAASRCSRSPPCPGRQVGRTLGPLLMLVLGTLSLCTVTDLIAVIAIFKRGSGVNLDHGAGHLCRSTASLGYHFRFRQEAWQSRSQLSTC